MPIKAIRNIAFIGANHSGKTTLVESILHLSDAITRRGKIQDGTTTTDSDAESIARQMSTAVAAAHTMHKGHLINILDCPGFVDFSETVKLALCGVDLAIVVVDSQTAHIHQIEPWLRYTEDIGLPRMIFLNKLDRPDTDFSEIVSQLKFLTGGDGSHPMVPIQYPISGDGGLLGFVDLLHHQAFRFGSRGQTSESTIPVDILALEESARDNLVERLADIDDEVLEMVVEGKEPEVTTLERDLREVVHTGFVTPVLVGSAITDAGVLPLLDAIVELCPSIDDRHRQYKDRSGTPLVVSEQGSVVAQVIATYINGQSGKLSLVRVFTGTVRADSHLVDATSSGPSERAGGLYLMMGKKAEPVAMAGPGAIVAIARLDSARTGDTLVLDSNYPLVMWAPPAPPPLYSLAIAPARRSDEAKLSTLLGKLAEEDPMLKIDRDPHTREYCMYGQGEVHLAVARMRLERKYHISVKSQRPEVAFRETIRQPAEAHGRHKKQTGGRGQFGEVYLKLEPLERGTGNTFVESIFGGSVPRQYIPGVQKGVLEALQRGPLANFPMVDVSVNLFDGSFHEVDSDEMSFRMAAILAMRNGLPKTQPVILEPVEEIFVFVPSQYTAGVLAQLTGRRGQILGYEPNDNHKGWEVVAAYVPQRELWDYITDLRSLTHGLGTYRSRFSHLCPVPAVLADELKQSASGTATGD